MKDKAREEELLQNLLERGDKSRVLLMSERGVELGYVTLFIKGKTLVIAEMSLFKDCNFDKLNMEDSVFCDCLMRAAASFAETNGANFIETLDSTYNTFLKTKGFETTETNAFIDMNKIVKYKN